jgi:hypothetical protein
MSDVTTDTADEPKAVELKPNMFVVEDLVDGTKSAKHAVDCKEIFHGRWANWDVAQRLQDPRSLEHNKRQLERYSFAPEQHPTVGRPSQPGEDSIAVAFARTLGVDEVRLAEMATWSAMTPEEHAAAERRARDAEFERRLRERQSKEQATLLAQALREALGLDKDKPKDPPEPPEPEPERPPEPLPAAAASDAPTEPVAEPERPEQPELEQPPQGPFGEFPELPPGLKRP